MFNNIGKKIKKVAELVTTIGIIIFVIIGIAIMAVGLYGAIENDDASSGVVYVLVGISVAVIGSLISWLMSFILYGYGELIDETSRIAKHFCGENSKEDKAEAIFDVFGKSLNIPSRKKENNE